MKRNATSQTCKAPTMLIILDGFGVAPGPVDPSRDATQAAHMPHWHSWRATYPYITLAASGTAVGLPPHVIGNSEVGHTTIGAGRIIPSVLARWNEAIASHQFFENRHLIDAFMHLHENNKALHIMGLLSNAGVHSDINHLFAFLKLAQQCNINRVYLHLFLDGRDMPPRSAASLLEHVSAQCSALNVGTIASIHGRFYAMDRDNNWDRIAQSYDVLTGTTKATHTTWQQLLAHSYQAGISDEFVPPTLLDAHGVIAPGDGLVSINIRPERIQELAHALIDRDFIVFARKKAIANQLAFFVSPVRYDCQMPKDKTIILFEHHPAPNTLLDVLAAHNQEVFIIAETEKYAHVTYFFRDENRTPLPHETCTLIPSLKVKTYAAHPEMSGTQIVADVVHALERTRYNFYLINFANADMVGHSADFAATVRACEFLDKALYELYQQVVEKRGGTIFVTADHGNAEVRLDEQGNPVGMHTTNRVPFLVLGNAYRHARCTDHLGLANIAPTILKHLHLPVPSEMEQQVIISSQLT